MSESFEITEDEKRMILESRKPRVPCPNCHTRGVALTEDGWGRDNLMRCSFCSGSGYVTKDHAARYDPSVHGR